MIMSFSALYVPTFKDFFFETITHEKMTLTDLRNSKVWCYEKYDYTVIRVY